MKYCNNTLPNAFFLSCIPVPNYNYTSFTNYYLLNKNVGKRSKFTGITRKLKQKSVKIYDIESR